MHALAEPTDIVTNSRADSMKKPHERRDRVALVVDADRESRESLVRMLEGPGLRVLQRSNVEEAMSLMLQEPVDLVMTVQRLLSGSGIQLLESARAVHPNAARALIAESIDMPAMCDAINRAGVTHLLGKPLDADSITQVRQDILEEPGDTREGNPNANHDSPGSQYGIIGTSPAIRALIDLIEKIGPTGSTVLVTGETGTGKELVGQAIHAASHRSHHVFSAINSAALPETLLESELFGHRRGAFTGASTNRQGLFEHADHGTVFLDELAEMPLTMQAKLLRFLQTGEVRPVGGETSRFVDVRLVSATNKDLEAEVMAGRFREDLFYRLAVIPITVPPLRERVEDIPLLVNHFMQIRANRQARSPDQIDPDAMNAIMRHSWPGNVRELQNVIERGAVLCSGNRIRIGDLPSRVLRPTTEGVHDGIQSLPGMERRHILETLDKVGWNRKQAASLLKISTTTLWRRLKEFGIDEAGRPGDNGRRFSTSG